MNAAAPPTSRQSMRHVPVMLREVVGSLAPRDGEIFVDGTFGAGGYTQSILDAADCKVIAIDRDPNAIRDGQHMVRAAAGRLTLAEGQFGDLLHIANDAGFEFVDGVVLDIGVSSMQIDDPERGFSFMRDGPLDMRMSQSGPSAADVVATLTQDQMANMIYVLGEEPKSRSIARAIIAARGQSPIQTTFELVKAIERATGPQRSHMRIHPATRTFQALRIYVNGELDELARALHGAERLLKSGGRLVVVTFHSLEDRIVKRFFAQRSGHVPLRSRHVLGVQEQAPGSFKLPQKGHLEPGEEEMNRNPRARSAKLRVGIRTDVAAFEFDPSSLGVPADAAGKRS